MKPLSQHALQAFRLTIATGTISEAAEALGRSQPAVTRLLQNLEAELGFPLFNRIKNRLVPTNLSLIFFDEVQRSFKHLDSLRALARDLSEGRERALSLGTTGSLSIYVVPRIVKEYHRDNPSRRLTLLTQPSASIAQKVQTQELDIGLVTSRSVLPGLDVLRQYRLPAVCIVMPGHPLSEKQSVTPEDVAHFPLILPIVDVLTGSQVDNAFQTRDLNPNIVARCQLSQMISLLVAQGMGVGIVDGWMASAHTKLGGIVLPFIPELPFEISLVVNSHARMSVQFTSLIDICDRLYENEASLFAGP
jgi:DNA-binding transcriptional LysR family regulator